MPMKLKILISFILCFLFFFIGFGFIVLAALNKNVVLMYIGISLLCLGTIGYAVLLIIGLRIYLTNKLES